MGARNERMYKAAARAIHAILLPVGPAFDEAYRRRPGIALQMDFDGNNPTLLGTYLESAVLYEALYGRSVVGNPYDYFGRISKDDALFLQRVAHDVVHSMQIDY
jgi:hypothetical protein